MKGETAATERAVRLIGTLNPKTNRPHTKYSAAKKMGIALSTIYKAVARRKSK